jgi:hypothetical protein
MYGELYSLSKRSLLINSFTRKIGMKIMPPELSLMLNLKPNTKREAIENFRCEHFRILTRQFLHFHTEREHDT